jgi:hypothetical protein
MVSMFRIREEDFVMKIIIVGAAGAVGNMGATLSIDPSLLACQQLPQDDNEAMRSVAPYCEICRLAFSKAVEGCLSGQVFIVERS